MIPFLALFNVIKEGAFKLPNIWRTSDSRQTGKNKELSSGSGARPQALDRQTAFPGSGDWGDHTSGDRRTGRPSGKRDSASACSPRPLTAQRLQRDCRGRGGEARGGSL